MTATTSRISTYFCFTVTATEAYYQACLMQNGYLIGGASGRGATKQDAEQAARLAYVTLRNEQKRNALKIAD
jgi:hypothetical protein